MKNNGEKCVTVINIRKYNTFNILICTYHMPITSILCILHTQTSVSRTRTTSRTATTTSLRPGIVARAQCTFYAVDAATETDGRCFGNRNNLAPPPRFNRSVAQRCLEIKTGSTKRFFIYTPDQLSTTVSFHQSADIYYILYYFYFYFILSSHLGNFYFFLRAPHMCWCKCACITEQCVVLLR